MQHCFTDVLGRQAGKLLSIAFILPQIKRVDRMLWIHAGLQKAVSSYVIECLQHNQQILATQGVLMEAITIAFPIPSQPWTMPRLRRI